ncbi:hypothetical protein P154DRAFT_329482 [Amniculicola lignicola CBS 123094]|uniref:Uncharacterized protein n=1 Tax=Amniculicola lignicola CBS 123094 TaxID=1392246 RepID=A0A6A5W797_9PLEO|nr:hypothetical protein P154DRAFT_329482 [Amniculicola lignicola CBS 123094]
MSAYLGQRGASSFSPPRYHDASATGWQLHTLPTHPWTLERLTALSRCIDGEPSILPSASQCSNISVPRTSSDPSHLSLTGQFLLPKVPLSKDALSPLQFHGCLHTIHLALSSCRGHDPAAPSHPGFWPSGRGYEVGSVPRAALIGLSIKTLGGTQRTLTLNSQLFLLYKLQTLRRLWRALPLHTLQIQSSLLNMQKVPSNIDQPASSRSTFCVNNSSTTTALSMEKPSGTAVNVEMARI